MDAAHCSDVRLDLQDLGFSDSVGLNALVRTHFDFTRGGRRLVLANVPARLRRLLELSGLDQVLYFEDDDDEKAAPGAERTSRARKHRP
jgi:anti-anti-sigma factor